MRARCVLYVHRRPADIPWARRTAYRPRSKPEDNTNTTPSSASSLPDVRARATAPRRWPAPAPRRTAVPAVTTPRTRPPRAAACPAAHPRTVTIPTASNQLTTPPPPPPPPTPVSPPQEQPKNRQTHIRARSCMHAWTLTCLINIYEWMYVCMHLYTCICTQFIKKNTIWREQKNMVLWKKKSNRTHAFFDNTILLNYIISIVTESFIAGV